eukprot:1838394-Karenia_brevis.AAC.1
MPPPELPQIAHQLHCSVIVQPENPPTTIEVVDKRGQPILVNINLHEDADPRIDLIDQIRAHEDLPRITWTED